MANIFRVVKDKNCTIVNNEYLKNKNLRVDSIGLLTAKLNGKQIGRVAGKKYKTTKDKL